MSSARMPSRRHVRVVTALREEPTSEPPAVQELEGRTFPAGWTRGQLLNVRNAGSHYNLTILGEEYESQHPERTLQFLNPADCQDFISWWYARESGGPLAR